jgi:uncharacterized protein YoxC
MSVAKEKTNILAQVHADMENWKNLSKAQLAKEILGGINQERAKLTEQVTLAVTAHFAQNPAALLTAPVRNFIAEQVASTHAPRGDQMQKVQQQVQDMGKKVHELQGNIGAQVGSLNASLENLDAQLTRLDQAVASGVALQGQMQKMKHMFDQNAESQRNLVGLCTRNFERLQQEINAQAQGLTQTQSNVAGVHRTLHAVNQHMHDMGRGVQESVLQNTALAGRVTGFEEGLGQTVERLVSHQQTLEAKVGEFERSRAEKEKSPKESLTVPVNIHVNTHPASEDMQVGGGSRGTGVSPRVQVDLPSHLHAPPVDSQRQWELIPLDEDQLVESTMSNNGHVSAYSSFDHPQTGGVLQSSGVGCQPTRDPQPEHMYPLSTQTGSGN